MHFSNSIIEKIQRFCFFSKCLYSAQLFCNSLFRINGVFPSSLDTSFITFSCSRTAYHFMSSHTTSTPLIFLREPFLETAFSLSVLHDCKLIHPIPKFKILIRSQEYLLTFNEYKFKVPLQSSNLTFTKFKKKNDGQ